VRIIFLFSQRDSYILIKALYEMASWLMGNRDIYITFYIPESIGISQFINEKLGFRYFNKYISAREIPEADIIISSDIKLLEELRKLNRGELLYLGDQAENVKGNEFKNFSITELGIGIPKRFFLPEEKRGKRVLIGGDQISKKELEKILLAIEKAAPSFYAEEIMIINPPEKIDIDTTLDYSFISEKKIDFSEQLKNAFYLIWISKNSYPIIPIWAMAAGVIVIAVNYSDLSFKYPLEINSLESMELALELMKTYKIGQYRNRLLITSSKISRNNKVDKVGDRWYCYLKKNLKWPSNNEEYSPATIPNFLDDDEYIVDIIIDNCNSLEYLDECISNIKEFIKLSYRITVLGNNINSSDLKNLDFKDKINLIEIGELNCAASRNRAILVGKGKYILFLNSAIKFEDDFIRPLVDIAEEEDVAVVGSSLLDGENRLIDGGIVELKESFNVRSWRSEVEGFEFDKEKEVLGFRETSFVIRRDLLPVLGLLDESYISYYEGIDYSLRAREKGYRVVYCPDSVVKSNQEEAIKNKDLKSKKNVDVSDTISKKRFFTKWSSLIKGGEKRREPEKIIVAGLVSWDYKLKRSQELVRNLAKLGYQILYLNPVCKMADSLKQVEDNIYVYTPAGYGTVLYNLQNGREINIGIAISGLLRKLSFDNCITIINASYWVDILKYIEYSVLVYDCIDNYNEYENYKYYKDYLEKMEEKILHLSDLVLVSSSRIYHQKKTINGNTYMLSNGFDKEKFSLKYQPSIIPEDIPGDEIIVGYFGPISSFFDIKLIKDAAKKYRGVKFLLVGKVDTDVSEISDLSNVIFMGEKSYDHLAEYIYYFDLVVLPYKQNEESDFFNPYNLYEYIGLGKRVLATNFPGADRFKGLIEIIDGSEEFIDKMGQLLSQEELQEDKMARYNKIRQHNWYKKAKDLRKMIHLAYYDLYLNEEEKNEDNDKDYDYDEDIGKGEFESLEHTINSEKDDNFLKTSSIENYTENHDDFEVEVKNKKSIIKRIINFFKKN